jgi:glycosyltransferase involved in cell wall biosynthesis
VRSLAATTPGVRFAGRLEADGVAAEIRRAAVVVLPSLWYEGFPTVVAEALAHGRPVIACDNPNMRAVVGQSGWLAPATAEGLATTLRTVLGDREEIERVSSTTRRRYLAEMTPAASYERLELAYRIAVERRGALSRSRS